MATSMDPFRNLRNRPLSEPYQQQAMIILAAIEEVHESKGSKPAPTTYFGAIMSSLDQKKRQQTPETLGGFLYLLSIVFPELPKAVFLRELETVCTIFVDLLQKQTEHTLVIRCVLTCVHVLLPALEWHMWAFPYSLKCFQALIVYSLDPRPPIRKLAQHALPDVLAAVSKTKEGFPKQLVDAFDTSCAQELKNCTPKKDCQVALYICGMLQQCVFLVPATSVFAVMNPLLQLSKKTSNAVLRLQVFRTLQVLFEYDKPEAHQDTKEAGDEETASKAGTADEKQPPLPYSQTCIAKLNNAAELVSKLVTVLMDVKPHQEDEVAGGPYGSALVAGLARLSRESPANAARFLAGGFLLLADNLLSTKPANVKHALKHLRWLMENCITPQLIAQSVGSQTSEKPALAVLLGHVETLLSFRYKGLAVCPILSQLFKQLNPSAAPLVVPLLQAMDSMREQMPEILPVFGDAIATLGPAGFFAALPLTPNRENLGTLVKEGRWWVLPLLKHVTQPQLCWFANDILPLAHTLYLAHNAAKAQNAAKEVKLLLELVVSLWQTFPYFCSQQPKDAREVFPAIAKQLATILTEEQFVDCRGAVCKGIYLLLTGGEETQAAVSPFAKKFLPVLFNLAISDTSEHVLRLIGSMSECDVELANSLFKKVLKKLLSESNTASGAEQALLSSNLHGLTDILMALVPVLDDTNLSFLYRAVSPLIVDEQAVLQKKAYQILTVTLDRHAAFCETHWRELLPAIVDATDRCAAGVQKHRLRCIRNLLVRLVPDIMTDPNNDAFPTLLGETILAIKEPNRKTRDTAFDLLVSLGVKCQEADETSMRNYVLMLMGGLAGKTPRMKGASVLALTRLVYRFRASLEPETLAEVLTTVLLLLKENAREVISAVLGFVKVSVLCLDVAVLEPHLPALVEGLTVWCATSRNRFRMKIRVVFEMLLKRYDPDLIKSLVPHKDLPLLDHILKTSDREARKKAEAWAARHGGKKKEAEGEAGEGKTNKSKPSNNKSEHDEFEDMLGGSDDDDDDEDEVMEKKDSKAAKGNNNGAKPQKRALLQGKRKGEREKGPVKMWIRDTAEVDMLDSGNLSQHVATTDPAILLAQKQEPKKSVDKRIYEDANGRIVVDPTRRRGKHDRDSDDEEGGEGGEGERKGNNNNNGKKKKLQPSASAAGGSSFKKVKRGDAIRKDGLEPFLFQKLDPSQLSRKRVGRATGKFESLISSAKKGMGKGAKAAKRAQVKKNSMKKPSTKKGTHKKAKVAAD